MEADPVEIRLLAPEDAESLVGCFERCYSGTHPADAFHDPAQVRALVASGRLSSVIAVTGSGEVVGHMALTLHAEGALAAEAGNTVVDPRHRGRRLAPALAVALAKRCLALGRVGFLHHPTTAHAVMQRLAVAGGGVECGVLLGYIPGETRYVGFESEQPPEESAAAEARERVAVVAVYQPLADAPARRIWIPARHASLARSLYARCRLEREVAVSESPLPRGGARLAARFEERRDLLRIAVEGLGEDLAFRVAAAASRRPAAPVVVDLSLDEPAVGAACAALAAEGFFLGALLPEYAADGDALRLQRIRGAPPRPRLATPGAEAMLAAILDDRAAGASRADPARTRHS